MPNDTVGIAGAIEEAIGAGIKVATSLFPIGQDLTTLEPQVNGITATAAGSPVYGATLKSIIYNCVLLDFLDAENATCASKKKCQGEKLLKKKIVLSIIMVKENI